MPDYSWIKPGVKARIIDTMDNPAFIGELITISSYAKEANVIGKGFCIVVDFEESKEFAEKVGLDDVVCIAIHIEPVGDDDIEYPDWNAIAMKSPKSEITDEQARRIVEEAFKV